LPDNVVQCILPDKAGNLWLSTANGISRFNPRDNTFLNFHESDGLQGEQFNRKACSVDGSGIMYFGGLRGFNIFDPSRIPAKPQEAGRVVLTEFRIHGKTVPVNPDSVLPKPIWELDALNLSHKDEEFSFEFAALSFRDQARTRYRFKLDDRESQWTEMDSRNRSARYTGVPPGNYRFRVQASTDGRTWSGSETSIALSIAPPWWKTPWSRGGAILALTALLFGGYKLRVRTLKERGRQLEKLVDQRTVELVEARNQAEQANRAKSAFLANMSHELRTPLNAILGFSNLLRENSASDDQRHDLDIINRSGEHLLTLINDVLDVAKIEAGRIVLEMSPCDLKLLVQDIADMMRVRATEKNLALVLKESEDLPRYVRTDGAKLREVLINLVGNAIKYTVRGSITLQCSAQPSDESERVLLHFEVKDTGIGIAPEDQDRVFRPFEQVAKAGRQKGTGLGLAITRQIVELMGGTIELESAPGKGSCFRVKLPVERTDEFEAKPAERERVLGLEPGQPEYRILIVEDEPENWMVLERLLQNAGFRVRVAENGEAGVESFREWRPQFIWMDLRMPVMNGIEAVQQIRSLDGGREVKIAAVTASGFDSQRSEVLAAGLDDYVRKPYRPDEIFACMARHLGVRYSRAEAAPESSGQETLALCPDTIAALPEALRLELRDAVVALDAKQISETIEKVAKHNAALGSVLIRYAKRFAYSPILKAIAAVPEKSMASTD
jgi:signal transduction histidine kinase/DNA-binding response OmpR family regulator